MDLTAYHWSGERKVGKIKCVSKLRCELCNRDGMLQVFFNSKHEVRYARIRHYIGIDPDTRKPKFIYHRQSLRYIERIFKEKSANTNLDHIDLRQIDLNNAETLSIDKNGVRGCPSLVGGRPAKSVVLWAARVQIPHPAPQT